MTESALFSRLNRHERERNKRMNYRESLFPTVGLTLIVLLLTIGCGLAAPTPTAIPTGTPAPTLTPTSTLTPTPTDTPTPTPTPTPVTPTATPTPSYPSFSKEEVLEIPSISAVVGEGEALFSEGEEPRTLRIEIDGSIPIVDDHWCLCCVATIRIEPNLQVPTALFLNDIEASPSPGGLIPDHIKLVGIVVSYPVPDDATEFIVSGPEGATLAKEGRGFLLVDGEAYLLQTTSP